MPDQVEDSSGLAVGERVRRLMSSAQLLMPMTVLAAGLLLVLVVAIALGFAEAPTTGLVLLLGIAAAGSVLAFALGLYRLRKQLLEPLARLEEAVSQVCSGEPTWRSPTPAC